MERVETLLEKLQQQVKAKSPVNQLLITTQMLQHELAHLKESAPSKKADVAVEISMPLRVLPTVKEAPATAQSPATVQSPPEKEYAVLQVDEAAIEAELEEIKKNAAAMQQLAASSHTNKSTLLFDLTEDDIPTLAQQPVTPPPSQPVQQQAPTTSVPPAARATEVNQAAGASAPSVNDLLKAPVIELSEKLNEGAVKDLRKAIGINDRFLYINELFRGDEVMYERSIKTINSFAIFPEAEYWIRRELKTKLGWDDNEPIVKQFYQLVRRRFS